MIGALSPTAAVAGASITMKLPVAAITMVFNEAVFLPIWLNHYGSALGYENLFVIDDGSTDMSVREKTIANLVSRKRGVLDELHRSKTISYFHEELLKYYDVVLYTDADEIIVPEPNLGLSLRDYLVSKNVSNWINPIGLNVLHDRRSERPLDLDKPLFSQRSYVQFDQAYCKPVIARVPMRWPPGFHGSMRPACYAADLFLFHLRAMDYDISKARSRNLNSVSFAEDSLRRNESPQFRMREQEYLNLYFSTPEAEFERARSELDFSDRLEKIKRGPGAGSPVARVPDRFLNAIELTTVHPMKGEAGPGRPDLDANSLYAKAISRLIAQEAPGRNTLCPCGSGKRFKHCHQQLVHPK